MVTVQIDFSGVVTLQQLTRLSDLKLVWLTISLAVYGYLSYFTTDQVQYVFGKIKTLYRNPNVSHSNHYCLQQECLKYVPFNL